MKKCKVSRGVSNFWLLWCGFFVLYNLYFVLVSPSIVFVVGLILQLALFFLWLYLRENNTPEDKEFWEEND